MSRHDPRKGLEVRLPDALRLRLVASTDAHLPLSYLTRQVLRDALARGLTMGAHPAPGTARPILLQLSPDERRDLHRLAKAQAVTAEVAVLGLLDAALPA